MQTILIIDDDPAGTQLLATLLKMEGYQPHPLKDWEEPLEEVAQLRPDLVIMDVYLRTTTGFALLHKLRSHPDPQIAQTPVLLMSAEDQAAKSAQAGAAGFLEKPFQIQDLLDAIQRILAAPENTRGS